VVFIRRDDTALFALPAEFRSTSGWRIANAFLSPAKGKKEEGKKERTAHTVLTFEHIRAFACEMLSRDDLARVLLISLPEDGFPPLPPPPPPESSR